MQTRLFRALFLAATLLTTASSTPRTPTLNGDAKVVAAQQKLPCTLVLPQYLPSGYTIQTVLVDEKPPTGNRMGVQIGFTAPNGGNLAIDESNATIVLGGETETIELKGRSAQYQELTGPDKTIRSVALPLNNIVSANLVSSSLTKDELLRIAASMIS